MNGVAPLREIHQVAQQKQRKDEERSWKTRVFWRRGETSDEEIRPIDALREKVVYVLASQKFDAVIGIVIVVNSLCMGFETSWEIAGKDKTVFEVLEHFFLMVYVAELSLRFFVEGWTCLKNPWILFDFVLVVMGVISNYIVGPILNNLKTTDGQQSIKDSMAGLLVLRMFRLFRLARAIRLLVQFKTLWMLIRGLIGSAGTIAYTFGLILLILYIFSCMALELITKKLQDSADDEVVAVVESSFPNLQVTMLTLMQFVTVDSISSIYRPLILEDPWLVLFFLPFILIVSISLMNLVTAVIVEGAIEQGKQDRDAQVRYKQYAFKRMLPSLKAMFHELDVNGDGTVTLQELHEAPESLRKEIEEVLQADSLQEIFEMIDVDDSGEVDIDEFCDGIAKLVNSDASVESLRMLKQQKIARKQLDDIRMAVGTIEATAFHMKHWAAEVSAHLGLSQAFSGAPTQESSV